MVNHLEFLNNKIILREKLPEYISFLKFKNKKIVFSNGCFDLIHRGHIEYLAKSASFGDALIIGLNTDNSVTRIKGANKPIQDEYSRALILASFSFVDKVVFFDEDTPYNLIDVIKPDFLIKGADYKIDQIIGSDIVLKSGGEVKTIELSENFSTTNIIKKIKSL